MPGYELSALRACSSNVYKGPKILSSRGYEYTSEENWWFTHLLALFLLRLQRAVSKYEFCFHEDKTINNIETVWDAAVASPLARKIVAVRTELSLFQLNITELLAKESRPCMRWNLWLITVLLPSQGQMNQSLQVTSMLQMASSLAASPMQDEWLTNDSAQSNWPVNPCDQSTT